MVVEYIRYRIPDEQAEAFAAAYRRAAAVLDADPHGLRYEFSQGVEKPQNWVVRIEWDSAEGHEPGVRTFLPEVRPSFGHLQEMKHSRVLLPP